MGALVPHPNLPESDFGEMPGRLLEMESLGLIRDLLGRHYEGHSEFIRALRGIYAADHRLLEVCGRAAREYRKRYDGWWNEEWEHRRQSVRWGSGSYANAETWGMLDRLIAARSLSQSLHARRYRGRVADAATHWMPGVGWGPEITHACLVTWAQDPTWRGTRLSVGGGTGPGPPVQVIQVTVQWAPDGHTWSQVRKQVLEKAKGQFDQQMALVKRWEAQTGRTMRFDGPPTRRRQTGEDADTRQRDMRWLFLSMCPFPPSARPDTEHADERTRPFTTVEIAAVEDPVGARGLELGMIDTAISRMRRELDVEARRG
jgi:hypothetical protein